MAVSLCGLDGRIKALVFMAPNFYCRPQTGAFYLIRVTVRRSILCVSDDCGLAFAETMVASRELFTSRLFRGHVSTSHCLNQ